jgi:hypothetical protein
MGRVWRPRGRGRHSRLTELAEEVRQGRAEREELRGEVEALRARVLADEVFMAAGVAPPAGAVPLDLTAAIAANARWVELPGCVALLSCGHNNPCQASEVWEAVQRVTSAAAEHAVAAGQPMPLPRYEPLPPGLRGVVTASGTYTICNSADTPRASQKAAAAEARVHGTTRGWLPGSTRSAGVAAAVSAAARKPALVLLAAGGAIGGAALIAVALAPCPSVLRPVQSATAEAQPPAVLVVPHVHRHRVLAASPSPQPQAPASPAPSSTPAAALPGVVPAVVRSVVPVPLPSVRPSPILCVRLLGAHVCLPDAA